MNDDKFYNELLYTAEPTGNLKVLKKPALNKIYTYPVDKNIKWYKPFPEFPNADQDKYFFKYEYINAITRQVNNLQTQLYIEQLREVIDNDIQLNDMKVEDFKLQQLNNYFKASLFSNVMNKAKENYLKDQAEQLAKNNKAVLDAEQQRAEIQHADRETLTLQTENSNIKKELKDIDAEINDNVNFLLKQKGEMLQELEDIKDILTGFEGKSKLPDDISEGQAENVINETLAEVGKLQDTELNEVLDKIKKVSKEEVEAEINEKEILEKELEEKKQQQQKVFQAKEKAEARKNQIEDFKGKIEQQKNINDFYISELDKIRKSFMSYDKALSKNINTTKDMLNLISLSNELRFLNNEELGIIKNNFPDMRASTKPERQAIRNNFSDFFKTIREGEKVDIKTFIDNIKIPDLLTGLDKVSYQQTFKPDSISQLEKDLKQYKKTGITGLGLKSGNKLLLQGEALQNSAEKLLNIDLASLIPQVEEGAIFEDKPPTTEVSTPNPEPVEPVEPTTPLLNDFNTLIRNINTQYNTNYPELDFYDLKDIIETKQLQNLSNNEILESARQALNFMVLNNITDLNFLSGYMSEIIESMEDTTDEEGEAF